MTTPFTRDLRARGKTPKVDHVLTSYPIMLRDEILTRLKAMAAFADFAFSSNVAVQVQPDDIPFCGVYLLQEIMNPEGDPNVGEVRFRTTAKIGISVIIQNNDSVVAETILDRFNQLVTNKIFTDNTLYDGKNVKVQAFVRGTRTHVFGNLVKDNETPMAELRIEIDCDLGTVTYEPQILDDLEIIHVETLPPGGDEKTTKVVSVYDLEQ